MPAVIFDVGGVLLVPNVAIIGRALSSAGLKFDLALLGEAHYRGIYAFDDETPSLSERVYENGYLDWLRLSGNERATALRVFDDTIWALPAIDLWSQPVSGGAE